MLSNQASSMDSFMPHGMCYLWEPDLLWLHVVSDFLTGAAYYAIAVALLVLVVRARKEVPDGAEYAVRGLPHEWVFLAFGVFIVACGTTHFFAVWNVWNPDYWSAGGVKAVTAFASVATAIALPPLIPRALRLVRNAREAEVQRLQLEEANAELRDVRDSLQRELESASGDIRGLALEVAQRQRGMESALREAQEARDAAAAASQAKTDFLAVMSHELRTPLNAVIGYAGLLEIGADQELTERQISHIDRIKQSSAHLLRLIDDILVFVRSDTRPSELIMEPVHLPWLIDEITGMLQPTVQAKEIRLDVEVEDVVISSDRERLLRIISNLATNAVKFTTEGHVSLRAALYDGGLRVVVEDTGPGISPEDHDRIFDAFWQGDQSPTRRTGGTGLGLSIARRVARQMGGDVTVESGGGAGSRFILSVPVGV